MTAGWMNIERNVISSILALGHFWPKVDIALYNSERERENSEVAICFSASLQCCCQDLFLVLETKTETWAFRSLDQDQDLGHYVSRPRRGQNELECT